MSPVPVSHGEHGRPHGDVASMIVDQQGVVEFANDYLLQLGGWDLQNIVGKPWFDVIVPHQSKLVAAQRFSMIGTVQDEPYYVETPIATLSGQHRVFAWTFTIQDDPVADHLRWMGVGIDVTRWIKERDLLAARIDYETEHDPLTGLVNTATFRNLVNALLKQHAASGKSAGVILINIDRFRSIDETAGRDVSDAILFEIAQRIKRLRIRDTVARWGGDEFAIAIHIVEAVSEVEDIARLLADRIHMPYLIDGREFHLRTRIGVALAPQDGDHADELMQHVSVAVDVAKHLPGEHVVTFSEALGKRFEQQVTLEQELHGAIERGEISVEYQAQIDAATRHIVGVEALARWHHPILGKISPNEFIPIAEGAGLIRPLGLHILREALDQARRWQEAGVPPFRVAVNISPRQLDHPLFVEDLLAVLSDYKVVPPYFELELTESAIMADMAYATKVLQTLAAAGIEIALDDFGTGYSCLAYLEQLQVSTIKLDRIFIQHTSKRKDPYALLRGLIALGKALDLRIIAEGVETEEQADRLGAEGVDVLQGFYFAKPLPPSAFEKLLEKYGVLEALHS